MDLFKIVLRIIGEKARDSIDDHLKGGTANEEFLRNLVRREMKDLKDSITDLARKDLLSAVSFADEGVMSLGSYEATKDEASLSHACECFDQSIVWSTHAFENLSLSTQDRLLAMKIKILSLLMKLQNSPELAVKLTVGCLHSICEIGAVKKAFKQSYGWKKMFANKLDNETRKQVCEMKRGIREFMAGTTGTTNIPWPISTWHPLYHCIDFLNSDEFRFHFICLDSEQNLVAMNSYFRSVRRIDIFTNAIIDEFKLEESKIGESSCRSRPCGIASDPHTNMTYVAIIREDLLLEVHAYGADGSFINSLQIQKFDQNIEAVAIHATESKVIIAAGRQVWCVTSQMSNITNTETFPASREFAGCTVIEDEIFLSDSSNNTVTVLDVALKEVLKFGKKGSEKGDFHGPRGLVYDHLTGHILICDRDNHRVQIVTREGMYMQNIKISPEWIPDQVLITTQGYVLVRCFNPERIEHKVLLVE